MKIDILTLFPDMFIPFLETSIIKRAISFGKVEIQIHNIRDYSLDPHKKVDRYGFGGGQGMVLMIEPIFNAISAFKKKNTLVILMTPQGETYHQKMAQNLKKYKHILIICGHYEGFDERIRLLVDMEISIGDFILTGGELPSMVITDSIVRLLDGVIRDDSHEKESFSEKLLDYPVYTKPREFMGMKVPDVLLSGNHEQIKKWRREEQIKRTRVRRPDLLKERDI